MKRKLGETIIVNAIHRGVESDVIHDSESRYLLHEVVFSFSVSLMGFTFESLKNLIPF